MSVFTQIPLSITGVRFSLSVVYAGPELPCSMRATLDVPSDEYTSQISGHDLDGRMTMEECQSAGETLLGLLWDEYRTVYGLGTALTSRTDDR